MIHAGCSMVQNWWMGAAKGPLPNQRWKFKEYNGLKKCSCLIIVLKINPVFLSINKGHKWFCQFFVKWYRSRYHGQAMLKNSLVASAVLDDWSPGAPPPYSAPPVAFQNRFTWSCIVVTKPSHVTIWLEWLFLGCGKRQPKVLCCYYFRSRSARL